jgi:hypothetical protein
LGGANSPAIARPGQLRRPSADGLLGGGTPPAPRHSGKPNAPETTRGPRFPERKEGAGGAGALGLPERSEGAAGGRGPSPGAG